MGVILHPGDHSSELSDLVGAAWDREECLVLCPAHVRDFRCLDSLPGGEVICRGDWSTLPTWPKDRSHVAFPERPLFGVFTTGTSGGEPRLIYYSRRNIEVSLSSLFALFDLDRIQTLFCYPQASHAFGLVLGYLAAKRFGWELVAAPGKYSSQAHAVRLARTEPSLLTLGTPAHFRDLIAYAENRGVRPAPSYSAIVGGGPVSRKLWLAMRDQLAIEAPSIGYGASEASPGVSHLPPGVEPREDDEIGFPLPHLKITLGETGLGFRGDSLALAIANGVTVEFPSEGFLADRIAERPDGRWLFGGRLDAVLNRGGEKFSYDVLESVLRDVTGHEVLATSYCHSRLGEELGVLVRAPDLNTKWFTDNRLRAATGCSFRGARWRSADSIPLGANGKPDRAAARALLRKDYFPVPVSELAAIVPHRPPMVWIDEVTKATPEGGECVLRYRSAALYSGVDGPRRSSLVEFLAQGFGYVQARARREAEKPKEAFLAAMGKIQFADEMSVADGEILTVTVRKVREMGPLALIEGEVATAHGVLLAHGQLKLYAR